MIRRPPRSTPIKSSAASDVYKRQVSTQSTGFYRYEEGQKFVRHFDGYEYGSMVYTQNADKKPQPKMTFLVYLNDSFEGGKTTFFNTKGTEILAVEPTTGNALVYTQKLLHEGSVVTGGRKYVLRSDILFGKPSPQQEGWSCLVQ
eukprot:TRINITY_DN11676_c0_g1_i3.p1 TRINITY_DN11676_c0_g1~~TRINITY_DN11676_c0_g1_i3.p1  ORF type:complete len:145 (-),score=29.82 TRINITY_DN11676_c0_g1_i3:8-442(-)